MSLDNVSLESGSPQLDDCEEMSNCFETEELEAAELEAESRAEATVESASQSQSHEPVQNQHVHIHVHAHTHLKQVKVEDFGRHRKLSDKTSTRLKRTVSHENVFATLHQH